MELPDTVTESRTDMPNAWYASTRQAWCFDEDEIRHCLAAYCANVTYMDAQVGRLLAALDRLGLADNTLVVYTADHGEMAFEHGMVQKHNFFEESVRVPLLARLPGTLPAGAARQGPVELLDLFPTFCELGDVPCPAGLEGQSLASTMRVNTRDEADRPVFSEFYDWGLPERMVRQGPWKYTHATGDLCQLYHLGKDPGETCNRIDDPACAEPLRRLRDRLLSGWEQPDMGHVRSTGAWNRIDAATASRLMQEWDRNRRRISFD